MNNVIPLFPNRHQVGDLAQFKPDVFDLNIDAPTTGVVVMRRGAQLSVLLPGGTRIYCTEHDLEPAL